MTTVPTANYENDASEPLLSTRKRDNHQFVVADEEDSILAQREGRENAEFGDDEEQQQAMMKLEDKEVSTAFNATSSIISNFAKMSVSIEANQSNASLLDKQMAALATTSLKVLNISSAAIARLIGDNGSNIDKVRETTGADVELEEQSTREEEDQTTTLKITIGGSGDAVRNAFQMIELMLKNHDLLIGEVVDRVLAPQRQSPLLSSFGFSRRSPAPSSRSQPLCTSPSGNTNSGKLRSEEDRAKHIVREAIEKRKKAKIIEKLRDDAQKHIVRVAIEKRKKIHPSGKILFFDGAAVPRWKRNFLELEQDWTIASAGICLAIYRANTDGNWLVEAIPKARRFGRDKRILLPWKGMQDAELEEESGIWGAYFVDPSGFIGGAKTIEAAMKMAEQTLKIMMGFIFDSK